ncbi:glycine--tRNA ligase, partial [Nanoarchaeota archaeon]
VGIEASVISHPKTWEASGHVSSFVDIAVVCKKCKKATKVDVNELGKVKCECGGEYKELGKFNQLFKTQVGALSPTDAYLRGETAQGMFLNFKSIADTSRIKLPFGIVQLGRCFRNEIAPRDFIFRNREFHIGEFEFFIHPDEKKCNLLTKKHLDLKLRLLDEETQNKNKETLKAYTIKQMISKGKLEEWQGYWLAEQIMWFKDLGINLEKIKVREHTKGELSHYSSATFDLDYEYPFGSKEVAGNANRGQYDLNQHIKFSKQKLDLFDDATKKRVVPKVIEPTFGIERIFLMTIIDGYTKDKKRNNIVLKLPPKLAPIKAAVFPIIKDKKYEKLSQQVVDDLKTEFYVSYDKSGSIGKRYARNDEAGTPYCITIDDESPTKKTVTIRDRDTTKQIKVKIADLKDTLRKLINREIKFEKAGKLVTTRVK